MCGFPMATASNCAATCCRIVPELRCLMLTSFTSDEAMLEAILAGASGYVVKDIKGMELAQRDQRCRRRSIAAGHAGGRRTDGKTPQRAEHEDPLSGLTDQERTLLGLLSEGLTNRQIAARMFLAEKTVKNYVSRLTGQTRHGAADTGGGVRRLKLAQGQRSAPDCGGTSDQRRESAGARSNGAVAAGDRRDRFGSRSRRDAAPDHQRGKGIDLRPLRRAGSPRSRGHTWSRLSTAGMDAETVRGSGICRSAREFLSVSLVDTPALRLDDLTAHPAPSVFPNTTRRCAPFLRSRSRSAGPCSATCI